MPPPPRRSWCTSVPTSLAPLAPTVTASFSPASILANGVASSTLTLTASNPNPYRIAGIAIPSGAAVNNGLTGLTYGTFNQGCTPTPVSFTNQANGSFNFSGLDLDANASCTMTQIGRAHV